MIKTKNLVILAAVLLGLAGLSFLQQTGHRNATGRSSLTTVLGAAPAAADLQAITLGYGPELDVVVLNNGPEGWVVSSAWNAAADPERIDTLLRNLGDLKGEFRSASAAVLPDYGLGPESAVHIRAVDRQGNEVLALDVGGQPEGFPGNFVRRPDEDAVYLAQKGVLSQLGLYDGPGRPQDRHFLKLQAVQLDRLDVDRLILRDGDRVVELEKEFGTIAPAVDDTTGAGPTLDRQTWEWRLTQPRRAALAKTKADGVLGAAVSIRATGVGDPAAAAADLGLDPPARTATLVTADGAETVLEFGAEKPADDGGTSGVWLRVRGDPTLWIASDYAVRNLFKTPDDLLPE